MRVPRSDVLRWIMGGACLAVLSAVGSVGCFGDRCGPGYRRVDTTCVPAPEDAAPTDDGGAGEDASAEPGEGGAAEDAGGPSVPMGTTCTEQTDCQGETNLCAILPGAASGYCTIRGCTLSPDDCPAGYVCTDLTAYMPDLIICVQE